MAGTGRVSRVGVRSPHGPVAIAKLAGLVARMRGGSVTDVMGDVMGGRVRARGDVVLRELACALEACVWKAQGCGLAPEDVAPRMPGISGDARRFLASVWEDGLAHAPGADPAGYGPISDGDLSQVVRDRRGDACLQACLASPQPSVALVRAAEADVWEWRSRGRGREAWLNSLEPHLTAGGPTRRWLLALFSTQGARLGRERSRYVVIDPGDGPVHDVSEGGLGPYGFRCSACGSTVTSRDTPVFRSELDGGTHMRHCPGCGRPIGWGGHDA